MNIRVLGSGSKGNCYLLECDGEVLIIECGIKYKDILQGLNFNISNVIGCLVSHEHKDHSKAICDLSKQGIDVFSSKGTFQSLKLSGHRLKIIESEKQFSLGKFTILPFETEHDSAEPLGFLIQHHELGKLLFVTDSYYCKYKFKDINHIMVECNYASDILEQNIIQGLVPWSLRNRLLKSHFSLENVKLFLAANDLSKVKEILLIHLSEGNSNPRVFKEQIERLTGKVVYIAEKNLKVETF